MLYLQLIVSNDFCYFDIMENWSTTQWSNRRSVYGDQAPSLATVKNWVADFKRGRTSIFDEVRTGRPTDATTKEMINKVHDIVLKDRRVKVRKTGDILSISTERVHNILHLHEHLGMRKL